MRSSSPTTQIAQVGAYIASLAPGPAVPSDEDVDPTKGDPARGGELFRVNCAMCHNFAGAGGALTRGKYAPSLMGGRAASTSTRPWSPARSPCRCSTTPTSTPESKRDVIAFLTTVDEQQQPGRHALGSLGPVTEGLFAWVFGLGILVGCAVWLGPKSA